MVRHINASPAQRLQVQRLRTGPRGLSTVIRGLNRHLFGVNLEHGIVNVDQLVTIRAELIAREDILFGKGHTLAENGSDESEAQLHAMTPQCGAPEFIWNNHLYLGIITICLLLPKLMAPMH